MNKSFIRIGVQTMVAILMSACASVPLSTQLEQKRERMLTSGMPVHYVDGYIEGCASYHFGSNGMVKDVNRAMHDAMYQDGWTEGFNGCRSDFEKAKMQEMQMRLNSIETQTFWHTYHYPYW